MASDNGPGLPEATLQGALDFTVRASNREAYVAPDRGAQGNALKTLLAMPYVVDPDAGKLIVIANGTRHEIVCAADSVTQQPMIRDDTTKSNGRPGTLIGIQWGERLIDEIHVWPFDDDDPNGEGWATWPSMMNSALRLLRGYTLFNPHLALRVEWFGKVVIDVQPTNTAG